MKIYALFALLGFFAAPLLAQETPVTNVEPLPEPLPEKPLPTLWLIGDSTVKNGTKGQQGWGEAIGQHFDMTKIRVENRARGGRSSRTFLTEGLWNSVLENLGPGDFVLMQFGHNDGGKPEGVYPQGRASLKGSGDETREVETKPGETEVVRTYGWYLRQYIAGARARGATPIVLSMVPRNRWHEGKVGRASGDYGGWAKEAAQMENVAFVDLNGLIADKYEAMGQEKVAPLFFGDWTHTSPAGAAFNAETVAEGLRALPGAPLTPFLKVAP